MFCTLSCYFQNTRQGLGFKIKAKNKGKPWNGFQTANLNPQASKKEVTKKWCAIHIYLSWAVVQQPSHLSRLGHWRRSLRKSCQVRHWIIIQLIWALADLHFSVVSRWCHSRRNYSPVPQQEEVLLSQVSLGYQCCPQHRRNAVSLLKACSLFQILHLQVRCKTTVNSWLSMSSWARTVHPIPTTT